MIDARVPLLALLLCGTATPAIAREGPFRAASTRPRTDTEFRWTRPQNGWVLGIPAHLEPFVLGGQMVVVAAQKNVSDHALDGRDTLCFRVSARDSRGRRVPQNRRIECGEAFTGRAQPGEMSISVFDLGEYVTISAPGDYDVTVESWRPGAPRARFFIRIVRGATTRGSSRYRRFGESVGLS